MAGDEIRYVRSHDGLHIAYQVRGDGPLDLLEIGGFGALFPHDAADDQPRWRRFEERVRGFARLIKFDLRGIGYSDQFEDTPTVDDWVADALAVMDEVGAGEVDLFASSFGGWAAVQLAATHPDRIRSLVLMNTSARIARADDYRIGADPDLLQGLRTIADPAEGEPDDDETNDIDFMAPSIAGDADVRRWWTRTARRGARPKTALAMWDISIAADVRRLLPSVTCPVLVMHSVDNAFVPPIFGRWLARNLPTARWHPIAAPDHVPWAVPDDLVVNEIEQFLTGEVRAGGRRSIKAILFTDIVESTARNAAAGDRAWLELLERHDDFAGREIRLRGGRLVKRLGDGLLAVFPLASDAIDTALAVTAGVADLGIGVRAGVHVAEVDEADGDVLGLGVNIAARVLGEAEGGEVLVTSAVADLLAGSTYSFDDRGTRTLKGIDGEWAIAAVSAD